jgi:two-component system, chemotaxis family, response regulator Rcp1
VLLVEEALREYRVDCALTVVSDGEEGMRFFQTLDNNPEARSPSLVLLDLNLPKRSGHEVLQVIRRSRRCPAISVVVVTSSQHQSDLAQMKRLGATAYFHKPSSFDEFMRLGALVKDLL